MPFLLMRNQKINGIEVGKSQQASTLCGPFIVNPLLTQIPAKLQRL